MNTKVNFAGIEMKNPVTVASGTFGYGREFADFFDLGKLGAVITKGTSLKIYEIDGNWGRTNDGWVCLDYTDYKKSTDTSSNPSSSYKTGRYEVTANVLNVRTGPGTNYDWKKYSELTANAQSQVYSKCGYKPNGLCKGVICDVSQVNENWGKIPSRLDLLGLL